MRKSIVEIGVYTQDKHLALKSSPEKEIVVSPINPTSGRGHLTAADWRK